MKNLKRSVLKNLSFSNQSLLKKSKLQKLNGGAQKLESALKVDDIKCRNALRDNGNGDGIW